VQESQMCNGGGLDHQDFVTSTFEISAHISGRAACLSDQASNDIRAALLGDLSTDGYVFLLFSMLGCMLCEMYRCFPCYFVCCARCTVIRLSFSS